MGKLSAAVFCITESVINPATNVQTHTPAAAIRQTVYLYGITGFGKTSFIRHFLGKKSYFYFSAAHLSKDALNEIKISSIVVIDDLQMAQTLEARQLITQIIGLKGIWLILVSRCKLSAWLLPTYLEENFMLIDEEDLALSQEDAMESLSRCGTSESEEAICDIYGFTKGNALFLRIATLELVEGKECHEERMQRIRQTCWDYLEEYDYEKRLYMN